MSTEMQRSVVHLKRDSVKIWKRLLDLYQRKAPLNRMYLQQEWKEFSMGPTWTMKRYVVQYQELVERMKAYDLHMSEEALVNQFLLGLTREYDVDRKLMCAREGLSLDEATNILLSESIAREIRTWTRTTRSWRRTDGKFCSWRRARSRRDTWRPF